MMNIATTYANQAAAFAGPYLASAKAAVMPYANSAITTISPYFSSAINWATPHAASALSAATYGAKAAAAFIMTPAGATATAVAVIGLIALSAIVAYKRAGRTGQEEQPQIPSYRTLARNAWRAHRRTAPSPRSFPAEISLHPQVQGILDRPDPTGPPRQTRTRTNTSRAHKCKTGKQAHVKQSSASQFSPLFMSLVFAEESKQTSKESRKPVSKGQGNNTPKAKLRQSTSRNASMLLAKSKVVNLGTKAYAATAIGKRTYADALKGRAQSNMLEEMRPVGRQTKAYAATAIGKRTYADALKGTAQSVKLEEMRPVGMQTKATREANTKPRKPVSQALLNLAPGFLRKQWGYAQLDQRDPKGDFEPVSPAPAAKRVESRASVVTPSEEKTSAVASRGIASAGKRKGKTMPPVGKHTTRAHKNDIRARIKRQEAQ